MHYSSISELYLKPINEIQTIIFRAEENESRSPILKWSTTGWYKVKSIVLEKTEEAEGERAVY